MCNLAPSSVIMLLIALLIALNIFALATHWWLKDQAGNTYGLWFIAGSHIDDAYTIICPNNFPTSSPYVIFECDAFQACRAFLFIETAFLVLVLLTLVEPTFFCVIVSPLVTFCMLMTIASISGMISMAIFIGSIVRPNFVSDTYSYSGSFAVEVAAWCFGLVLTVFVYFRSKPIWFQHGERQPLLVNR